MYGGGKKEINKIDKKGKSPVMIIQYNNYSEMFRA